MLNQLEQEIVSKEIEKLFKAQGKNIDDETKLFFISEMSRWQYPISQIQAGIKNLFYVDMKILKLGDIRRAVADLSTLPKDTSAGGKECRYCLGSGLVSLLHSVTKSSYAFACVCAAGDKPNNRIAPKWDGKEYHRHGRDEFRFWLPVVFNAGRPAEENDAISSY